MQVKLIPPHCFWHTQCGGIFLLALLLPNQNRLANPIRNQLPVTGGVVVQQGLHHLCKLAAGEWGDLQLVAIQTFLGVHI